uniref:Uncharacterized protein n=2 Tax=Arion vulgaris TaxID=1028688 RepID=A0A0B6ZNA0_9EUPU
MQSVILEAVADIFQDYYQTVRLHTVHNMEQPTRQKKDIHLTAPSATGFPMTPQTCSLKSNIITPKTEVMLGSETDKKDPMFISSLEYLQNIFSNEAESAMSRLTNYTQQVFPNSELMKPYIPTESQNPNLYNSELKTLHHCYDDQVYDNFQSKISAWMTAVDIVSVLQSLGSLVISGVDSNEITSDMTLL